MFRYTVPILGLVASLIAHAASASVIYSNGSTDGSSGAGFLDNGYAISDSLAVSDDASVTEVEFTVWNSPGETPASVDWAFTTEPDSFPDQFTSQLIEERLYPSTSGGDGAYSVEDVSFAVSGVSLSPGTWYLVLQNGFTAQGGQLQWDDNSGPSIAYQRSVGLVGSQTFTVYEDGLGVPEPGTWGLMLLGAGIIGANGRGKRRQAGT